MERSDLCHHLPQEVNISCQSPHPNEDPTNQFGFGITLKSKSQMFPVEFKTFAILHAVYCNQKVYHVTHKSLH